MVLSLERWIGKTAVVTGASSGIGESIATRLVEEGLQVVAIARRKEKLDALVKKLEGKKGKIHPIQADINNAEDVKAAFKWIKSNLGPVHILINNAGVSHPISFLDDKTEDWANVFQTNVVGSLVVIREAVNDMKENNVEGHIIIINSTLGHMVLDMPNTEVYTASKHAITSIVQSLKYEMARRGLKVKITSINPGLVDTPLITESRRKNPYVMKAGMLAPGDITEGVIYALSTPSHVRVSDLTIEPDWPSSST